MTELTVIATGQKVRIVILAENMATLDEALERVDPRLRKAAKAKIFALIKRLSDHGNLRMPDHFNKEATLPDDSHFYAVKTNSTMRLRAYGWYSSKHKGTFVISHFAFKRGEKLDDRDTARVNENWRSIER